MTVVATFEFNDFVATGKTTGQADSAHRRFGAGVHHAHHIHGRDQFGHQLRHFHFHFGRCAKAQTTFGGFNHGIADRRMVMAQHHRPPGTDIIDIGFAINIVQISAVRFFDKQWSAAHAGKGANRGVHTARDQLARCAV